MTAPSKHLQGQSDCEWPSQGPYSTLPSHWRVRGSVRHRLPVVRCGPLHLHCGRSLPFRSSTVAHLFPGTTSTPLPQSLLCCRSVPFAFRTLFCTMATAAPPVPPVAAPADDPPRAADADGEMVDIVDRSTNAVLRSAPRAVVHAAADWHRCVHVYLFAPDGRMLLQRRSPDKRVAASAWDGSAAEHVVAGEAAPAAAVRGVAEELGVSVKTALRGGRLVRVRGPCDCPRPG